MASKKIKTIKVSPKPYYKRHLGSNEARYRTRLLHRIQKLRIEKPYYWWKERGIWQKIGIILSVLLIFTVGSMYGIAQWYIAKHSHEQVKLGTTFIPSYARYFNLDPEETFDALIYDAGFRNFRLVSYWDEMERSPGNYDFTELDWQFKKAEQSNSKISLAIGLRQPRWPECHMPQWAMPMERDEWAVHLKVFMGKVIQRYKASPALETYQLENEFFLKVFGECPDFSRSRLVDEYNFVKQQDPSRPVIVSRSNNGVGFPVGEPRPDISAVSVYKRVWDKTVTKRYFEYPFPAWFYGFLAGGGEILTGRNLIIHELQAEPWTPEGIDLRSSPRSEQDKSMNAVRLKDRINYGRATGMKSIDLWGSEWWYWRKVHFNDPSLWNVAKEEIQATQNSNTYR